MQPHITTPTRTQSDSGAANGINHEWLAAFDDLRRRYPKADLLEVIDAAGQRVAERNDGVLSELEMEARWQDAKAVDVEGEPC